ncbi:MAG TPA: glycoside hydrolase family 97 N-terminal domain-containing protein, partial [Ignavibacteriaceae bacterium]|nr:glycoside hydrolase family 97 N-terminal domain-containing protein [Ignavibacteriaceae bacterium]
MRYLLLFTIFLITPRQINSQEITSPDNKLKLTIKLSENGELFYNLMIEGLQVIKDSKLGIDLLYQADLIQGFEITDINNSAFSEEWKPVWGEVDKILNNYNQMQLTLNQQKEKRTIVITFRVFNDGIGFRYEFPKQENLNYFTVLEENTEFNLTGDHKTFWIPGDYDSQEYVYTTSLLSEINSNIGNTVDEIIVKSIPGNNIVQTPLMLKSKEGLYINIHEAALLNYPVMYLTIDKDNFSLKSHLCPDALNNKAYLQAPCTTPWR